MEIGTDYTMIPTGLFQRLVRVLDAVEPIVIREEGEFVSEKEALRLLGCGKTKLHELKKVGHIRYSSCGKAHRYCRKSLEKYKRQFIT